VKKTVMALSTVLLAAASAGGQDTARQKASPITKRDLKIDLRMTLVSTASPVN